MAINNGLKKAMIDGLLAGNEVRCVLLDSDHTIDIDTQVYLDDVNTNEIVGTGYTANGQLVSGVTTVINTSTDTVKVDCDDITFSTLTVTDVKSALLVIWTGDASTSLILSQTTFDDAQNRTAADLVVQINALGIMSY